MTPDRWHALMLALDLPGNEATYFALCKAYQEPHRHYHTQAHIQDCLQQFDLLRAQAVDPSSIELAIWFHDAIYDPYHSDNEQKSAEWATRFLHEAGAASDCAERVSGLIMATRHAIVPSDHDTALLIDVDLSILGAGTVRYAEFEAEVRREYRWVPLFLYRRKRANILDSFRRRTRIFAGDLFHERYESQARLNLNWAIAGLTLK
jgi:predicted metal-dependent HD superfamily phosphohydrolase